MGSFCLKRVFLFRVVFGLTLLLLIGVTSSSSSSSAGSSPNADFSCNCDYCNATEVIDLEDDESTNKTVEDVKIWETEDLDGDGDRTICARDRDAPDDRHFSSICHMMCHNKCTRYRIVIYLDDKVKKYIASVFRTNYYKLHDGPC